MDKLQSVTIAAHFFFVAVAQSRLAEKKRGDAGLIHLHAFDAVGRDSAFDERMLAEYF